MDEIGGRQRLHFRKRDDAFRMVDAFQEPRHVVRQRAHRLEAFDVFADVVGRHAMDAVPVLRRDDRHVRLHEVLQKAVVGGAGAAAAGRNDGRGRLVVKVWRTAEEDAVEQRRDLAVRACVIDRGADDDAVGFAHQFRAFVDDVFVAMDAEAVVFVATAARKATADRLFADMENGRLNAVFIELRGDFGKRREGAAFFVGNSVDQ